MKKASKPRARRATRSRKASTSKKPKRTAKAGRKKQSIFRQRQQGEKRGVGQAETAGWSGRESVSQKVPMKKRATYDLPDFSADWEMPRETASTAEVTARFYYEFARESETILSLTEALCHFTRGEILSGELRGLSYPGEPLRYLHAHCASIAGALMPRINLREKSWNQLEPQQRESLIRAFSNQPAFREQHEWELASFIDARLYPKKPPVGTTQPDIYPQWFGSSRLYCWSGVEYVAILIDWNQGPQAVKAAMQQWFQRHKHELLRLKAEGKLPGYKHNSYRFHLRDETGAKNPRRKYLTALRGLGAMRLLSSHSLTEAIWISRGSGRKGGSLFYGKFDAKRPTGHGAWKKGIDNARKTFQELFYPQDDYSLHLRRSDGLPDLEEPISYQRYCKRG
jgi:hypothetical protein